MRDIYCCLLLTYPPVGFGLLCCLRPEKVSFLPGEGLREIPSIGLAVLLSVIPILGPIVIGKQVKQVVFQIVALKPLPYRNDDIIKLPNHAPNLKCPPHNFPVHNMIDQYQQRFLHHALSIQLTTKLQVRVHFYSQFLSTGCTCVVLFKRGRNHSYFFQPTLVLHLRLEFCGM